MNVLQKKKKKKKKKNGYPTLYVAFFVGSYLALNCVNVCCRYYLYYTIVVIVVVAVIFYCLEMCARCCDMTSTFMSF